MGGFIKGIVVGVSSFVLGFAVLSVVIPVEPPHDAAERAEAPQSALVPEVQADLVPEVQADDVARGDAASGDGDASGNGDAPVPAVSTAPEDAAVAAPSVPDAASVDVAQQSAPEADAAPQGTAPEAEAAPASASPDATPPVAPAVAEPEPSAPAIDAATVAPADAAPMDDTSSGADGVTEAAPVMAAPQSPVSDDPPAPDEAVASSDDTGANAVAPAATPEPVPAAPAPMDEADADQAADPVAPETAAAVAVPARDGTPEPAQATDDPELSLSSATEIAPETAVEQADTPPPAPVEEVASVLGGDAPAAPVAAGTPPEPQPDPAPAPEADSTITPARPQVQTMPTGTPGVTVRRGATAADTAAPQSTAPRQVEGVTVGRLPRIGAAAPAETGAQATDMAAGEASLPAYQRFAAPLNVNPDARLMGVVLIESAEAQEAVVSLPFPVTLAMDPYDPEGPQRAEAYRMAGHDIALLAAGVPPLANASDIATTLQVWLGAFPQIVAVMDVPVNGIGTRRALANDMASMLQPEGIGVIALRGGVDAFLQAARDGGLATASVFRTLDDGGQSLTTISRLIDRAAFEAQRTDGIVITGAAGNPETLSALTAFAEGGRRSDVTLVPASALLATE